ncbi:MAG: methionine--tRNA ligase subunit beta [Candidatus Omnitrophota bacterium]
MITYEDFRKMELKIATIKDVQPHPNADKLYVLTIDAGGITKQLVAGIRLHYSQDSLKGKQIVVVDNLEPAVIRGIESQGMLLAACDEAGISVLSPDRLVQEGSLVK